MGHQLDPLPVLIMGWRGAATAATAASGGPDGQAKGLSAGAEGLWAGRPADVSVEAEQEPSVGNPPVRLAGRAFTLPWTGDVMHSLVKDVMTTDVATVRETAGYKDIIAVMRERRVSALPVLDSADHLVGVVSEADLLLKEVGLETLTGYVVSTGRRGERAKAAGVTAADVMTAPAVTIGPEESVTTAARRMHERGVRRLPVLDAEGRLAGIVSCVDVLSVFDRPDEDIRDEVVREIIAGEFALDPDAFDVTVRCGVITITGQVESHAVAAQLSDALRHVEGVVDVRDRVGNPWEEQPQAAAFIRPRPPG